MPCRRSSGSSGYNAIATAAGETMTFANDRPVNFEMIEIGVLRQPGGGKIDVKLDGVVETSYDLSSPKAEPVVIRLLPTRGATERVRDISITTTGRGPVTVASVAIYNKQSGLTFNSIGYPGAQASFVNKFNNKLLANDLIRINPQIVILSFGTNEASNESLDLNNYRNSYERILDKIKTTLPEATVVVIGPPDFAELPAACRKSGAAPATCGRAPANGNGASQGGECAWRTPPRLQSDPRSAARHCGASRARLLELGLDHAAGMRCASLVLGVTASSWPRTTSISRSRVTRKAPTSSSTL